MPYRCGQPFKHLNMNKYFPLESSFSMLYLVRSSLWHNFFNIRYCIWLFLGKFRTRVSSNNQIFYSVRTETNWNSICFGCFSVCFAKPKNIISVCFGLFRFVLVCFGVSDQYRNNRNKQNFLETNRNKPKKNLHKSSLLGGPRNY
jgi:hypothetical protein